jgi:hypothetical protein
MWKVYLFEFIVVLTISILWVHLIDKSKDLPRDENDQLF